MRGYRKKVCRECGPDLPAPVCADIRHIGVVRTTLLPEVLLTAKEGEGGGRASLPNRRQCHTVSVGDGRYCLAILNGPKSTAHEYLNFPCLLSPSN